MRAPSVRVLLLAATLALGLGLAALGAWFWYGAQERRADAAHAQVLARVAAASGDQAPAEVRAAAIRDLEQLIQQYPSARMIPEAAYELANVRYGARDYAGARSAYELALARGATGTIRTLARAGAARTWEAEGKFDRAAGAYEALLKDLAPRAFLFEETLLDLARMQELTGHPREAIATYQRLLKDAPGSRRSDDVRARLASLGASAQ